MSAAYCAAKLWSDPVGKLRYRSTKFSTKFSVFAQEVDGGETEDMLLNRISKRLLSNNLKQKSLNSNFVLKKWKSSNNFTVLNGYLVTF